MYQITFAQLVIWGVCILLVKLSILLLYRSLFHCMEYTLIAIYVCIALNISIWILQVGILFGSCKPLAYNWDPTVDGSCAFKGMTQYIIYGSLNLFMDVALVILPAPEVWRLQHISRKKKIGISLMFGLGAL
jgi:hypothetical protein